MYFIFEHGLPGNHESPFHGQIVHIDIQDCHHLSFLYGARPALGMQNEDLNILLSPQSVDSSRSSITTCCSEMMPILANIAFIHSDEEMLK
jgi:hypothetical protein